MNDTVECPYCEHENDMSEGTIDLPDDNCFDHECEKCEQGFEVHVEFYPSYSSEEIKYGNCQVCGKEERDLREKGRVVPFPKEYADKKICRECFRKAFKREMDREEQEV